MSSFRPRFRPVRTSQASAPWPLLAASTFYCAGLGCLTGAVAGPFRLAPEPALAAVGAALGSAAAVVVGPTPAHDRPGQAPTTATRWWPSSSGPAATTKWSPPTGFTPRATDPASKRFSPTGASM